MNSFVKHEVFVTFVHSLYKLITSEQQFKKQEKVVALGPSCTSFAVSAADNNAELETAGRTALGISSILAILCKFLLKMGTSCYEQQEAVNPGEFRDD